MAFAASGLYVLNYIDVLDASQLAVDLSLTTHRFALYTNTKTPNYSSDASYSATNEVSGTGWAAAGPTIATVSGSPTVTESPSSVLMYDLNDISAASTTLTNVRGLIEYADALTTPTADANLVGVTFGADYSTSNGTFGVQWASTGVFTIDLY